MTGQLAAPSPRRFIDSALYARIRATVLSALAALGIAVLLLWPRITDFYSYNANYYNGIVASAAISAILAISLNLCMGYGGLLSMMHTGLQLLGGYAVAITLTSFDINWMVGIGAAIVLGAMFSVIVISFSLRATYLYFGMITLAADLILVEAGRAWKDVTGGVVGISGVYPTAGGELLSKAAFYYVVIAALGLVYIVQRNLVKSRVGRAAMAVRESSDTAAAMGIWPARSKVTLFAIAGGIGGLAGALYALQLGFVNPDVGLLDNGLILFVGLFLGGISTLTGPVIGIAVIALLMESIKDYARYTTLILGSVLLLSMMVVPRGVVGSWSESRWGRRRLGADYDEDVTAQVPVSVPSVALVDECPVLEGRGLVKHFGGVAALDGVNFQLRPGTIHGVIGPNGSGKSTLVSCLTRYHRLDAGQLLVDGMPAPKTPHSVAAGGIARVFQVPHLFERVTVLDNVLTGMHTRERYTWLGAVLRSPAYRRQDKAHRVEAQELLRFAGLGGRAEWPASALSHGQKRLLEVVRAVATHPRVLILDEPATGLTSRELDALAILCTALRDRGIAILLIEHNIDFVMSLCEAITVIESGKVIEEGDPEKVRTSPAVIEAYLGRSDLLEEPA